MALINLEIKQMKFTYRVNRVEVKNNKHITSFTAN